VPSAKLGHDIRIFRLVGELIELGGTIPTNPRLDHFVVSTINSPVIAGKLFNVTVTAVTSDGRTLKTYDDRARITDLTGTVKPETTAKFKDGVFKGKLNITKSMTSDKLTFTDTASNKKGTSNAFNVVADTLIKVDLSPSAVTIQPGEKAKFTAKGFDKFGNEISGLTFAWSLSSSDHGSISTSGNVADFTASSTITNAANVTLTATISGGTLTDASKISIIPKVQTPDHFEIEDISGPKTAGALFQITVKALNATGGIIKTYGGPMTLTDTTGSLNMTVSSGFSNGVWTGNVNITKAASDVKITAKDVANPARKGTSNEFNVVSGSLAKLDLTPSAVAILPAQKADFTAKALDKFGNEISPSALTFAWSLSSSDFGSIATNGNIASFTASSTVIANTNVTLTANVGSISDESKITIKPAVSQVLDHFEIHEIGQQTAGVEFSIIAKAMDAFGNVIKDYNGNVTLSTNNGNSPAGNASELSPNPYPFNSDDEGQHTFQVKLYNAKAGVTISISGSGRTSSSNAFNVVPSSIAKVIISPNSVSIPQGEELDFKARAQDSFGNAVTGATFSWSVDSFLGTLESNSGSEVEFTALAIVTGITIGSITATSGSISGSATITVTPT
jgi:hypothetical protein